MLRTFAHTHIVMIDIPDIDYAFRHTTMDFEGLDDLQGCNSVYSCQASVFPMWF